MNFVEEYFSETFEMDNIDSLSIYYPENWIIATAKNTHQLLIFDKSNLKLIKRFGGLETFNRPNGIAIIDDFCFIVERDNKRIQVFELPSFKTICIYGEKLFKRPYGIAINKIKRNNYQVYITDSSNIYKFEFSKNNFSNKYSKFGYDKLSKSESLCCDPQNDRLFVADEGNKKVFVFDLKGKYKHILIDTEYDPEGIDIYKNYIILTEQSKTDNKFHVFNRNEIKHIGYFKGKNTKNTDGIKICKDGMLFAVDDDKRICCIEFEKNVKQLNIYSKILFDIKKEISQTKSLKEYKNIITSIQKNRLPDISYFKNTELYNDINLLVLMLK